MFFKFRFAPSNLDFEMIGKDLRSRTCLTTAGDNGVFEFFWTQGENGKKKNKNQVSK